jgi:adenosylhomocysteine nucleosidase
MFALQKESQPVMDAIKFNKEERVGRLIFHEGQLSGVDVVVVVTGVGKVLAAGATAILIDKYRPDLIISAGVAGGLGVSRIFETVIASDLAQHDFDTTAIGEAKGLLPLLNAINIHTSEVAKNAILSVLPNLKVGTVVSGDKFVAKAEESLALVNDFNAVACDMECAAIGHIAALENTDVIAVKVISDGADINAAVSFEQSLAKGSAMICDMLLETLQVINNALKMSKQ